MTPDEYDAWYNSTRGQWIGEVEYQLAKHLLQPEYGELLLDIGCGTGWFSRRLAADGFEIIGVDTDLTRLAFARSQSSKLGWIGGDARQLPFHSQSFDRVVSIAAIGFIDDERQALAEIVRVTSRRFAVAWLNRSSLLYRRKASSIGYRGCRWRTMTEIRSLFAGLPIRNLKIRSAVFLPDGSDWAQFVEPLIPHSIPLGSLLIAVGDPR